MKKLSLLFLSFIFSLSVVRMSAQQLPDSGFEDWSSSFDGNAQPAKWHGSNVSQAGFKFTLLSKATGRSGSAVYIANKEVGAVGITETSPGYFGLGQSWNYVKGLDISSGCGGMEGGISFAYRPDTVSVWIKRTGSNASKEDFNIVYYAWKGQSKGEKYRSKGGSCSSTTHYDAECDIRIALNKNTCGTSTYATQVSEGWYRSRGEVNEWTNIRIPIYYFNDEVPEKVNLIFSPGNYPNSRSSSGLYANNGMYVDDVELIYSAKIQKLYVDGVVWNGFNPNTEEEQVYSLGESATVVPDLYAMRGAGMLKNQYDESATFTGRRLTGSEISISKGAVGEVTTIKVKSGDGKTEMNYKIRFVKAASTNAYLAGITVDGVEQAGFNAYASEVEVQLPYGTTAVPTIGAIGQDAGQTYKIEQASSLSSVATIVVTAADGKTQRTYTVRFKIALLSDNTLQDILVNGSSVAGFVPDQTTYRVSLPLGTTQMPTVKAVSKYKEGEQTIVYQAPDKIEGGTYQIQVTTPGNTTPKIYKLNFRLEASTYSLLKNLTLDGVSISDFESEQLIYYVTLPMGTTSIPTIGYEMGDPYQTVSISPSDVNGTTLITVKAASGATSIYKIIFTTPLSENSLLEAIYVNGVLLSGFEPNTRVYTVSLPVGTTDADFPVITWKTMDEFQTVDMVTNGVNGITRITVTAGNGTTTQYQLQFKVVQDEVSNLNMIYIDGVALSGFDSEVLEYTYQLPSDAVSLPVVTYDKGSEFQSVTMRAPSGLTGDYVLTVRPQSGAVRKYTIHFVQQQSSNALLSMIQVGGVDLEGFEANSFDYIYTLPAGVSTLPEVTFIKSEESQKVVNVREGYMQTLTVTAQDGTTMVYTITFVVQKSESAFLSMIYIDGDSLDGFDQKTLAYSYTLTTATCPSISVQRGDSAQQVSITAPYSVGQARILVTPEAGAPNVYTIDFVSQTSSSILLSNILVDGVELASFEPTVFEYSLPMGTALPTVVPVSKEGQTVQVLNSGNVVTIYVQSGSENSRYVLTFSHEKSNDTSLQSILIDGSVYADYVADRYDYTVSLAAGSKIPSVEYVAGSEQQTIYAGFVGEGVYQIMVTAEDGVAQAVYTVTFEVAPYSDARLQNIVVEGQAIEYKEDEYDYYINYDAGQDLPELSIETKPGQTTLLSTISDDTQEVLVMAESGARTKYTIHYQRVYSDNVQLKEIRIGNDLLSGFDPEVTSYIDSLAWRTRVVPSIQPVGMLSTQTITTYRSSVNGTTRINVLAPDGKSERDYYIYFPVVKSSNTKLSDLYILSDDVDLSGFDADITDYAVLLPYGTTQAPAIRFEKAEEEQTVKQVIRPIGQTSELIVTAENGDSRTYRITFTIDTPHQPNLLKSINVKETGESLDLSDTSVRDFNVNLPYGIRSMTITYTKQYAEQTVIVEAGGLQQPTRLVVKANVDTVPDEVYTLTPIVPTADPAVLTDIMVNGSTIAGFESERFSYIVNVSSTPVVEYVHSDDVAVNVLVQNDKHWQARVTYNGRSNIYDMWYYYPSDVIPNADFTDWTKAEKQTSADKPESWSCVADAVDKQAAFDPANLASKENESVVNLKTIYSWAGGGDTPGYITLGKVSGSWGFAGSSSFVINGSITFRNSPDELLVNYYLKQVKNKNQIQYILNGQTFEWNETKTTNGYQTYVYDLTEVNQTITNPSNLNIVLNSFYQINRANAAVGGTRAEMLVDWIKLAYNHTLTGLTVNGIAAEMKGKDFAVTLTDDEDVNIPQLRFTGEVKDQAQKVEWSSEKKEGAYGVRTATIRNFAENGTDYTDYTLEVKRPLCTDNTLDSIYLGGEMLVGFSKTRTDYTCDLTTADVLPDIQAFQTNSRQILTTTFASDKATITVTPEYGEPQTYTINFVVNKNSDTRLSFITELEDFDPEQRAYTFEADSMPDFYFTLANTMQTVELNDGVFTVTAEDGQQDTYTVTLQPRAYTTPAQMSEIELDGTLWQEFSPTEYTYTHDEISSVVYAQSSFRDSVVFIQDPKGLTWKVYGMPSTTNTYRINYPTEYSNNAQLEGIYIDGLQLEGFDAGIFSYTVPSDTSINMSVLKKEDGQKLTITETDSVYTIVVTAEDGMATQTYTLTLARDKSDNAYLDMIYLDGEPVDGFRSDSLTYTVVLPAPAVKTVEQSLPVLTYKRGQHQQKVELQSARLGETAYIVVTAESGRVVTYEVLIEAEPSHNADLTGIIVNDVPMERFEVGRHYYSTWAPADQIDIQWTADDNFQTVTLSNNGYTYNIHVVAQDGLTTQDYQVDIFVESVPNDARLKDILIDGISISEYEKSLNPKLHFDPDNNTYLVNLPAQTGALPQVYALLKMDGQDVALSVNGNKTFVTVTAKDGITQITYTIEFAVPLSSVAILDKIFLDGNLVAGYQPNDFYYYVELPVGVQTIPEVVVQKHETAQKVNITEATSDNLRTTVQVTAEDGVSKATYTIVFAFQVSDYEQLDMIYIDGDTLTYMENDVEYKFDKTLRNYILTLPVGTTIFPDVTWDLGDEWQTAAEKTIDQTSSRKIQQIYVTAASGKQGVYTLNFEIEQSDNTALNMLYIDDHTLVGFSPDQTEYFYTVPAGTTVLPKVDYEAVDASLQTVAMDTLVDQLIGQKSMEKKVQVTVTAQNHSNRIYTIHFPMMLSSDTLLSMIWNNNQPLTGFNKEVMHYTVDVPYNEEGLRIMPAITVNKSMEEQKVDIVSQGDSILFIYVLSEDALHRATYRIDFAYGRSPITTLEGIIVDGEALADFDPSVKEYNLYRFADDAVIPQVEWNKSDPQQWLDIDLLDITDAQGIRIVTLNCAVTAPDQNHFADYTVYIRYSLTELDTITLTANLDFLSVNGMPVSVANGFNQDFFTDSLRYEYNEYPIGSPDTVFFDVDDVTYKTHTVDTLTHVQTETNSRFTEDGKEVERVIVVQVSDRDYKTTLRYEIVQRIALSRDSTITMIYLDGEPMIEFAPAVHNYQVKVKGIVPGITFQVNDTLAYAPEVIPGVVSTDTTTVPQPYTLFCMSEYAYIYEKSNADYRNVYTIEFVESDIDESQKPTANDVLVKVIPNSNQLAVASLRANVQFAVFDAQGHLITMVDLPAIDPRYAIVTKDANGNDYFNDVSDISKCTVLTIDPQSIFFYTFFEDNKRVVKSGKLMFRY